MALWVVEGPSEKIKKKNNNNFYYYFFKINNTVWDLWVPHSYVVLVEYFRFFVCSAFPFHNAQYSGFVMLSGIRF
jgi:hypothetical protein